MSHEAATTVERELRVVNRMGVHARPATRIVEITNSFKAKIQFVKDGEVVDGKSIFGVMTLAAVQGTTLKVRASGEDACELLDALDALFRSGFGEMETGAGASAGASEARA